MGSARPYDDPPDDRTYCSLAEAVGQAIEDRDPWVHELSKPLAGLAAVIDRTAARLVVDLNRSTT